MALLEPTVIPGLDRALLELLAIFSVVCVTGLVVTISSIVGVIRAIRRRRRGGYSVAAVVLAALANAIAAAWLLYWLAYDIHDRAKPINALLVINVAICLLPSSWLIAAIRTNRARRSELVSQ
jgi:uncharacterized protein with PQ loop repeat